MLSVAGNMLWGAYKPNLQRAASGPTLSHPQGADTSLVLAVQIRNLRCFTTSFSLLSPLEGTLSKSALRELSNHRETLCLLIGCTRLCFIHIKIKVGPGPPKNYILSHWECAAATGYSFMRTVYRGEKPCIHSFLIQSFHPAALAAWKEVRESRERMGLHASTWLKFRLRREGLTRAEPECWLQLEESLMGRGHRWRVRAPYVLSLNLENLHPAYSISAQQRKLSPGVCQSRVFKLVPKDPNRYTGRSKPCCIHCYHAVVGRPLSSLPPGRSHTPF